MEVDETDREILAREINEETDQSLDRLFNLWKMIGIKNLRENRLDAVLGHIKRIYATMVAEEEANLDKITKNIQRFDRERLELRRDLGIQNDCDDSDEAELSLVDVEYKIRTEVSKLRDKKAERMKVFTDVRDAEKALCESTGTMPCDIVIDRMPTDGQVKQVERNIVHLRELRNKREKEFEEMVAKIHQMYEKLESEPRNSKERHLVCSNIGSLILSQDNMDSVQLILQGLETEVQTNYEEACEIIDSMRSISEKLRLPFDLASKQREFYSCKIITELREELQCLEQERKKHMAVFIKAAATELEQVWDRCYAGEDAKSTFKAILETKDDEESILTHYESNIKAWNKFHDEHRLIISKIDEWYSLWADRLQLETCMKDPSRLGNFKALREEEKKRNRVNKRLPKIVEEIQRSTAQYFEAKGQEFLIRGMTFQELNDYQQTQHDIEVQQEKERKKEEKKKLMVQESIYGVAKNTKTPVRSANKTMRQVKRLQHDSKLGPGPKAAVKSFATPGKPVPATPGSRRALRERNETFVSGSHMAKINGTVASVNDNIFNNADVASSTMKAEQIRQNLPTPIKNNAMSSLKKYNTVSASGPRSRALRSGKKIPFLL